MQERKIKKLIETFLLYDKSLQLGELKGTERGESIWFLERRKETERELFVFIIETQEAYIERYAREIAQRESVQGISQKPVYIILKEPLYREREQEQGEFPKIYVDMEERQIAYTRDVPEESLKEVFYMLHKVEGKRREATLKDHFKPWITYFLMAINVVVYFFTVYISTTYFEGTLFDNDVRALILLGAKYNPLIAQGEYFRLFTCTFLHGGLTHIALNMYALYAMGPLLERVYGRIKFSSIYVFAGITGSYFSYLFSPSVSIGASGAIFGCFGALLIFGLTHRDRVQKAFIKNIASVIGINIIIGLSIPNIDNMGHVGGLVGGVVMAGFLFVLEKGRGNK